MHFRRIDNELPNTLSLTSVVSTATVNNNNIQKGSKVNNVHVLDLTTIVIIIVGYYQS